MSLDFPSVAGCDDRPVVVKAEQVNATLFKPFELFIAASLYYLLLTTIWTIIQSWIESQLGERKGMEKEPGVFDRIFSGGRIAVEKGGH